MAGNGPARHLAHYQDLGRALLTPVIQPTFSMVSTTL
jgi:hypothetical protein